MNPAQMPIKELEELSDQLSEKMEGRGFGSERLDATDSATGVRKDAITEVKTIRPELNGQADAAIDEIQSFRDESDKKRTWYEFASQTAEAASKPFQWGWEFAKAHPYITGAVVLTIVAIIAYYTGAGSAMIAGAQKWIAAAGDLATGGHVAPIGDAVTPINPIDLAPGVGPLGTPPPSSLPYSTFQPPSLPTAP